MSPILGDRNMLLSQQSLDYGFLVEMVGGAAKSLQERDVRGCGVVIARSVCMVGSNVL
jgi:hypothetical protein